LFGRWPGTSATAGHDLAGLRADLDRFTFLLGGDDGEQQFGEGHVEHPPDVRCVRCGLEPATSGLARGGAACYGVARRRTDHLGAVRKTLSYEDSQYPTGTDKRGLYLDTKNSELTQS